VEYHVEEAGPALGVVLLPRAVPPQEELLRVAGDLGGRPRRDEAPGDASPVSPAQLLQPRQEQPVLLLAPRNPLPLLPRRRRPATAAALVREVAVGGSRLAALIRRRQEQSRRRRKQRGEMMGSRGTTLQRQAVHAVALVQLQLRRAGGGTELHPEEPRPGGAAACCRGVAVAAAVRA
jgi:hypothetical protein